MKTLLKLSIIVFAVLLWQTANSQDNTLYNLKNTPQQIGLNPANQPRCNWYIELPVLSSFSLDANNGFTYQDVMSKGTGAQADSFIVDLDKLESGLADENFFRTDLKTNILGFGFRAEDFYFSFNVSTNVYSAFGYPKSLLGLRKGNWEYINDGTAGRPRTLDLGGLGLNALAYNEIALGASRKITPNLTIGLRLKYLMGIGSVATEKTDIQIHTDAVTLNWRTENPEAIAYTSFPIEVYNNPEGDIDSIVTIEDDQVNNLLLNKNRGFGIDLGATYVLNDQFRFSAAVLDLGFIRWKQNSYKFRAYGEAYEFEGIDFYDYLFYNGDSVDFDDELDQLEESFHAQAQGEEFTTGLYAKVQLSANYQVTDFFDVGVLSRNVFRSGKFYPELTLSANIEPTPWLSATLSYSAKHKAYNHIGLGFVLRGGPVQFYLVTDHFIFNYTKVTNSQATGDTFYNNFMFQFDHGLLPYSANTINLRFGLNLVFGCKKKTDIPSIPISNDFLGY